jgi:hypothetical protein
MGEKSGDFCHRHLVGESECWALRNLRRRRGEDCRW